MFNVVLSAYEHNIDEIDLKRLHSKIYLNGFVLPTILLRNIIRLLLLRLYYYIKKKSTNYAAHEWTINKAKNVVNDK